MESKPQYIETSMLPDRIIQKGHGSPLYHIYEAQRSELTHMFKQEIFLSFLKGKREERHTKQVYKLGGGVFLI